MYRMILGLVLVLVLLLSAASPLATEPQAASLTAKQWSVSETVLTADNSPLLRFQISVLTIDTTFGPAINDYLIPNILERHQ